MELIQVKEVLIEISRHSGIVGILFFLVKKPQNREAGLVLGVLTVSFICAVSSRLFVELIYPNSFVIANFWCLVDFFISYLLFRTLLKEHKPMANGIFYSFLIVYLLSFSLLYSFTEFNIIVGFWSSLAIVLFSLMSYYCMLQKNPVNNLWKYPVFWITTSMFLYASGTLLFNILLPYLILEMKITSEVFQYMTPISFIFDMIKNLLLSYSIFLMYKGYPSWIYDMVKSKNVKLQMI
ncbi:MAG: hypothetical protein KI790_02290 [Cyclobacteriaceae bacterium]|nr:hypothetical protein [Cyclobacteriaceae bacterium HetDA_MAG_MS6]